MSQQPRFVASCPGCQGSLSVTRLSCGRCGIQLEGSFPIPALLRLPPDDLAFVLSFVRASGSLKALAQERKQSYPTIRNRLDEIIRKLGEADRDVDGERHAILDALGRGDLSAEEAAARLREVAS